MSTFSPVRLDSWKQIAAYLDKSERTVRRWQQTEGLPVHKHQHQAKGSVWAYQHEIDEWLAVRRVSPEPLVEEPPTPPPANRERWFVAALALIAVAAIGGWIYSRTGSPPTPITTTVPFTSLTGVEHSPAISPDGTQAAFFWGTPNRQSMGIYVKRFDAEQPVAIDTGNGFAFSPAWSPDGKTIAFLRRTAKDGTWLCLVGANGGPARNLVKLTSGAAFFGSSRHISWGPDGRWLLAPMQKPDGEQGIYAISVEGNPKLLTESQPAHSPMIAPDGRSFAYVREGGSPIGIYEITQQKLTPAGERIGGPIPIFKGQGMPAGLDWVRNGKELVLCLPPIVNENVSGARLYRLAVEAGAKPTPLGPEKTCSTVAISKGRLLFGASEEPRSSIWRGVRNQLDQPSEFAPSSRLDEYPSFSPDGKSVAFVSNRSGQREVWISNAEGNSPRRITEGAAVQSRPVWSADGSRLLFESAASQPKGLMTVPIAGGTAQPIQLEGQLAESPVWSRDGRKIYYSSGSELWSCMSDGSGRKMIRNDGWQLPVGESKDGKSLYVVKLIRRVQLVQVPLPGGPDTLIASLSERLPDRDIALTQEGLYFVDSDGGLYLWRFQGKPELVQKAFLGAKNFAVHRGLSVSPDQQQFVWGKVRRVEMDIEQIQGFR